MREREEREREGRGKREEGREHAVSQPLLPPLLSLSPLTDDPSLPSPLSPLLSPLSSCHAVH